MTEKANDQRSGKLEIILSRMKHHAEQNTTLLQAGLSGLPEFLEILPGRFSTEVEDLRTIADQLEKLRTLATEQGYVDVLKVLDEELPYDRGY